MTVLFAKGSRRAVAASNPARAPARSAVVVRSGSVPRGDAAHQGSRPRRLLGPRGRMGLASTVGPVLVGVVFAFAWSMAASHGPELAQPDPGLAPTVGTAVDQAADQAWASATPLSTYSPALGTSARPGGPASIGCHRVGSSRVVRVAPAVGSAHPVACSSPRHLRVAKKPSGISASTTAWSVHRRPGRASAVIVVVQPGKTGARAGRMGR